MRATGTRMVAPEAGAVCQAAGSLVWGNVLRVHREGVHAAGSEHLASHGEDAAPMVSGATSITA